MLSAFIHYSQSKIHYLQYGSGSAIVICLHGYGENANSFEPLVEWLPEDFSLIAIDLPFHGITQWKEKRAFTIEDFSVILTKIFQALDLKEQPFILAGYSMGGRIAMSMLQYSPAKISKLILLAPDGMKVNFWYWLSTQTTMGNRLFRFTMNNPRWLLKLVHVSDRFGLINKSVFKFISTYIGDAKVRDDLFNRWTCMRSFKPDTKKIRAIIQRKHIPIKMIYGKHDRIILAQKANRFCKGMESLCELHIIDTGHQILQQKHGSVIANLLTT